MLRNERNIVHNPLFRIWDFGNGPFSTNSDRLATRWTLRRASGSVDIQKTTFAADTLFPKLFRSRDGMRVIVNTVGTFRINQFAERMEQNAPCFVAVTLIAMGPLGGTFKFGVGENLATFFCDGTQTPVTAQEIFSIDDIAASTGQGEIIAFMNPTATGNHYLCYMGVEYLAPGERPSPVTPVHVLEDRARMAPFAFPVAGIEFHATAAATIRGSVKTAPFQMRAQPAFVPVVTSGLVIRDLEGGGATSATTPSYTFANSDEWGGRLAIGGFSGLTVGRQYRLEHGVAAVLDADY